MRLYGRLLSPLWKRHPCCQRTELWMKSFSRYSSTEPDCADDNAPLLGVRVLDMTRVLAGPLCTMILGDLGADVIKIEKPGGGDETRNWGPPFIGDQSCYFLSVNRNKKSVAVDVSHPDGSQIVQELARKCDVFVHNFLPGKLEEYGLGYEDIRSCNSGIVYCSISGYGEDGPYRHRGGYDVIASAIGGMMGITGPEGGEPCKIGTAMTDISTGLYAYGAVTSALLRKYRTGKGAKIECNLLSTQVASLVNLGVNYLNTGKEPKRWGTAHESIVPYQAFETADGEHLVVGAGSDAQFVSLCQLMGVRYFEDVKFRTNAARVENRVDLVQLLAAEFSRRSLVEWQSAFKSAKFPYGPINSFGRVFSDPQVLHSKLVTTVEHKTAGSVRLISYPVNWIDYEARVRLPPPLLGEHTDQTLASILGCSTDRLSFLRGNGVIN